MNHRDDVYARSIRTAFDAAIRQPFLEAVKRYDLIRPGDRIAVCISGGKDSMLLALLMQMLAGEGEIPFEVRYLIMDPGYNPANRQRVEENALLLGIPYDLFESDIFRVANGQTKNPCFLCARMRRGFLYARAEELGCNKIALGHHFNDVIETTLIAMLYGGQLQAMAPKIEAKNFPGMELIRPLYLVREEDIIAWRDANRLTFIRCACRFTENSEEHEENSKRRQVKLLLQELRKRDPDVEQHVFDSIHRAELDTMPGWKYQGKDYTLLDADSFSQELSAKQAP